MIEAPTTRRARQEDWESRLRSRPSAAAVRLHVEHCRREGWDPVDSCLERWGAMPAVLMRNAPEIRGGKGRRRRAQIVSSAAV